VPASFRERHSCTSMGIWCISPRVLYATGRQWLFALSCFDTTVGRIYVSKGNSRQYLSKPDLSDFFEPKAIAVIGSFRQGSFGGYVVVKSLLKAGYSGRIYPINPAYTDTHGLKVYPSIAAVQEEIDLAIIMINAQGVPSIIRDCADKGIRAIILVSDGFAERSKEGARLQNEIVTLSRQLGIRIIGPNTAGIVNTSNGLNPCPYDAGYYRLRQGSIAICSQTGMTNPQAFPFPHLHLGISNICDFGNKCDVDECDVLEYLEADPRTNVITMYLEGISDSQRFLSISKRVAPKKPILILKSGRTPQGARASASHTGAIAADDRLFEAMCRQAGVIRLESFEEVFEIPKIFATQPLPKGNRLGIITYTGAIAVLALDEGAHYGLVPANLTAETADLLNGIFPGLGIVPVDIGPMSVVVKNLPDLYPQIVGAVISDENVDALLNIMWADHSGLTKEMCLKAYEQLKICHTKPVATWLYGPDTGKVAELAKALENLGFPVFSNLKTSMKALGLAYKSAQLKKERLV
jgi:acyl-CoA synthetase (NDP forming)